MEGENSRFYELPSKERVSAKNVEEKIRNIEDERELSRLYNAISYFLRYGIESFSRAVDLSIVGIEKRKEFENYRSLDEYCASFGLDDKQITRLKNDLAEEAKFIIPQFKNLAYLYLKGDLEDYLKKILSVLSPYKSENDEKIEKRRIDEIIYLIENFIEETLQDKSIDEFVGKIDDLEFYKNEIIFLIYTTFLRIKRGEFVSTIAEDMRNKLIQLSIEIVSSENLPNYFYTNNYFNLNKKEVKSFKNFVLETGVISEDEWDVFLEFFNTISLEYCKYIYEKIIYKITKNLINKDIASAIYSFDESKIEELKDEFEKIFNINLRIEKFNKKIPDKKVDNRDVVLLKLILERIVDVLIINSVKSIVVKYFPEAINKEYEIIQNIEGILASLELPKDKEQNKNAFEYGLSILKEIQKLYFENYNEEKS
ncbi:hypothetical protein HRbin34_00283 [bacterium HR34]|nr:hypothetical protein HRbin34_00283 [bacterium HR34]